MDLEEIQSLIKFVSKSGVTEVELETKDFKLTIKSPVGKGKKQQEPEATIIQQVPVGTPMPGMQQVPVQQPAQPQPQPQPQEPQAPKEEAKKEAKVEEEKLITIKSPMIGTFYRSADPEKPPFVNVGDEISPGKVICIIEAMKLFNEIEAEVSGKIVKVLVDDAAPVEYDQPLFLVEPA